MIVLRRVKAVLQIVEAAIFVEMRYAAGLRHVEHALKIAAFAIPVGT